MSGGKGKLEGGVKQILKGMGACGMVCFILLCLGAALLQKGNIAGSFVRPFLAASVFLASLIGCFISSFGGKQKQGIYSAVPGILLALTLLTVRWCGGQGSRDFASVLMYVISALAPALLFGLRRSRKRKR